MRARTLFLLTGLGALAAGLWWRKNPSPCPYGLKLWVEVPHPIITRERLRKVLEPRPGERVLEIGPGTGYYTLDISEWVGPGGTVEILDLQQKFLDHTMRRAEEAGRTNLVPTLGDATDLPYEEDSIDAVVLTTVLGEIPDRSTALREIARVLKPGGRLVVGELFLGDPHFTSFNSLQGQCGDVSLLAEERSGNWFGYFARFASGPPAAEAPAAAA